MFEGLIVGSVTHVIVTEAFGKKKVGATSRPDSFPFLSSTKC